MNNVIWNDGQMDVTKLGLQAYYNWTNWFLTRETTEIDNLQPNLTEVTNRVPELAENATDSQRVASKEAEKKDCKAAYCIQSAIDSENFDKISYAESVKETLRWQYEFLHMGEDEKIAGYVSNMQNLIHLMKGCGETITDKMIVEKAQTWKKHDSSKKFKGKGYKTQSKKSWSNPHKNKVDDRTFKSLNKGEENSYQKDKEEKKFVEFYNCEKWVHLAKNCWNKKYKGATKSKDEGANLARQDSNDFEDMVVMDVVADDHVDSRTWFLDSGFLNHMTSRKVWLVDFDESKKSKVKLSNNSSLQAEGTGDIDI
ncbi:uncharacterized protein LOC131649727 [Vicia villosa]|uniref:uncharacterized protein LOC131649727 n=1 Tax=Vicia villosa TaxID=3911 RepID=UPI00273C5D2D|nr:uncharacterized protein LOC131649727 [Vicia villosa]